MITVTPAVEKVHLQGNLFVRNVCKGHGVKVGGLTTVTAMVAYGAGQTKGIDKRCHYGLPKWNEWRHFPVEFVSNMERILGRRGVRLLVENWGGFQMVHNDIQLADA